MRRSCSGVRVVEAEDYKKCEALKSRCVGRCCCCSAGCPRFFFDVGRCSIVLSNVVEEPSIDSIEASGIQGNLSLLFYYISMI